MTALSGNAAQLGDFVAGMPKRNVPDDVLDAARLCFADWLAVAIGAGQEDAGRIVRQTVAGWKSEGRSTVLYGSKAAAPMAALANGTLAHCLDFDDTYVPSITHTSAPVWAAVLALGEAREADELSMLRAYIAGFEVVARVGNGLGQPLTARGLHGTGVFGRIGAAAACASLLGLNAERAAHALAIAATQASGLGTSFGTMAKPFHAGRAAMDGVLSAELAASGFVGGLAALEPGGLDRAYIQDGSHTLKPVTFEGWEILNNSFKPYAACHLVHAAVDGARGAGVDPAKIKRVHAHVSPLAMQITGVKDGNPATPLAAKFDLKYCIALGLHGKSASAADFLEPWRPDGAILATAKRIDAEGGPEIGFASAKLDLEMLDGGQKRIEIPVAKGNPGNPMLWSDMALKMDGLARDVLAERTSELLAHARGFGSGTAQAGIAGVLETLAPNAR